MSIVKSFSVGNGDTFYIKHGSDSFTIIDCSLSADNADRIIDELQKEAEGKGVRRFISTHPDEDHFGGIHLLDEAMPITNFYVVKNQAVKDEDTLSFTRYCQLKSDLSKAFYISKDCSRKWMTTGDDDRGSAGISILWPDTSNAYFIEALAKCDAGESYNNTSAVIRYSVKGGASFLWLGDLDTEFMEKITGSIELTKTTVVFAAHHGRKTGKIPDAWLRKLDPQIIVIGEAPSRHLNYYTGYDKITQNLAGDITMDVHGEKVDFYVSNTNYKGPSSLKAEGRSAFPNYIGTLTVETEYTLGTKSAA